MTDLDRDLRDVLHHQAAHAAWEPTPAETVAARARRVRRRRRAGAVVGAAVLVATVAVPTALVRDRDGHAAPAVTQGPASAPPRIGYAVEDRYRYPDGRSLVLPAPPTSITPLGNDLLVTDDPGAGGTLHLRRVSEGRAGPSRSTTSVPVVAADGTVAFTLSEPTRDRPTSAPVLRVVRPSGQSSERVVAAGSLLLGVDDTGATALADRRARAVVTLGPEQVATSGEPVPGIDVVQDYTSATRLFVDVRPDGAGGGVVDDTGRRLWERDDVLPGAFSPDGEHLLAARGADLDVLDAGTGATVGRLPEAAGPGDADGLRDVVWEDDTHLLATRTAGDGRQLVRVGPGGTVTPLAVPPIAEDADLVWDTRP